MREIKFRFWDPRHKLMLQDHDGWTEDIGINFALECSASYGYIPLQYTGWKDKNGGEVYEGDIISWEGAYILWDEQLCCFAFNFKGSETPAVPLFHIHEPFQVLGNIFQHPNLINK